MLQLERLVKHYHGAGEKIRAVDGVDLEVESREMVALQGPSGSGKTTLLLLIAGLLAPDEGVVRFGGRDLAALSEGERSAYLMSEVGFIYQTYRLMPRVSTLENAALKLVLAGMGMREAKSRAQPLLERLGLGDRLSHTPEDLSGGERQRVSIARALTGEPRLILADEPTGNLDSVRSVETIGLLTEIAHENDAAAVLVTHDADAARLADRVFSLRDGRLQDEGRPVGGRGPGAAGI